MNTIIRIIQQPVLPERPSREEALRNHFGGRVQFIDWTPPENPGELFDGLREKLMETEVLAVELDSKDRSLTALLAVAVIMLALQIPVRKPTPHLKTIPVLVPMFNEGRLAGYAELKDVCTVANERTDIIVS
jgi:hypothetical protein